MSGRSARGRWFFLAFVLVLAALAWNVRCGWIDVPDRWIPWKPLHIADAPNWLTRFKLARLGNVDLCRSVLSEARMRYTAIEDHITESGCGFSNAVRISESSVQLGEPIALSCPMAVSLAMWELHSLRPKAFKEFAQPVVRIEHFGSYACRNLYGRASGPRSQHATANALDLAGIVLADGQRIRIVGDWNETGPNSRFLHAIRQGACRYFDVVLSPDYNAAHRDHLHLERGKGRACR